MAKLIILCGLPGSGKSFYAKNYKAVDDVICKDFTVIHSSDAIREELFGDPSFQGDNAKVFELMHKRVKADLQAGKTVIYDATNVTRKARRGAIKLAHPTNDIVECHIVWAEPQECIRRDNMRERKVGPAVIDKMLRRWQSPWKDEGFTVIKVIHNSIFFDHVQYIAKYTDLMHIPHDNPHHQLGVWEHCQEARKYLNKTAERGNGLDIYCLLRAAMWHDIGKPYTKFFKPGEDVAHYYDHHCVGGYLAYGLFLLENRTLIDSEEESACFISWLISTHMEPFFDSKYYKTLNPEWKRHIDILHEADVNAH